MLSMTLVILFLDEKRNQDGGKKGANVFLLVGGEERVMSPMHRNARHNH